LLHAHLKECEAAAGEHVQQRDALQLQLKDARFTTEAAQLQAVSQEQELSAEVQRLKSELAVHEANASAIESVHQQALQDVQCQIKCIQAEAALLRKERNACYAEIAAVRIDAAQAQDEHTKSISDLRASFGIINHEQLLNLQAELESVSRADTADLKVASQLNLAATTPSLRQSLDAEQQLCLAQVTQLAASKFSDVQSKLRIEAHRIKSESTSSRADLHAAL
jgi:hypothetical protein